MTSIVQPTAMAQSHGLLGLGYRVIDADGHLNDWHLDWAARVPPEYRAVAPRSILGDNRWRQIEVDGLRLPAGRTRLGKTVTRPAKYWLPNRPGEQDPVKRLPDMDEMGIDVAVLFGGHAFLVASFVESPDAAYATMYAYNTYLAEYCRTSPSRLKGVAMAPMQAPERAAQELRRAVGQLGMVAAVLPPHHVHGTMLGDKRMYPIYETAQDLGIPICIHTIGIQINPAGTLVQDPVLRDTYGAFSSMMALGSLIIGGVLEAFPRLAFAFLEAGVGWVPYIVDRLQFNYEFFGSTDSRLKQEPKESVRDGRIYIATDPDEPLLNTVAQVTGEDRLVVGSDYCHPEGLCPFSMKVVAERQDLSEGFKRKLLSENPSRLYGLA